MTNNKIRTKILELESPNKVKTRLKESGVISNEVSDNTALLTIFKYIHIAYISLKRMA